MMILYIKTEYNGKDRGAFFKSIMYEAADAVDHMRKGKTPKGLVSASHLLVAR